MRLDDLLADKQVKRWYTNLSKGSILTASRRAAVLGRFQDISGIEPSALLGTKNLEEKLIDIFDKMEHDGLHPTYIVEFRKAIKSWLDFNGIPFNAKKIKIRAVTPRTYDEQVPTAEQLRRVLSTAPPKTKVMISLMAFSFLRPESLGKYVGDDGLKMSDFPELEIKGKEIGFSKVPTVLVVRDNLSKAKHRYSTFVAEEGCNYIKDYLSLRKQEERLQLDSPLFPGMDSEEDKTTPFMTTDSITKGIRRVIRKVGFSWRPYVLRSYGDTQLDIAEARGLVSHSWRQFWMGHKGDIEARYSTNKRLAPEVIEEMRNSYAKIQDLLQTAKTESVSEEKIRRTFKEQLLLVAGFSKEEIGKLDLESISDEDLQQRMRQRLLRAMTSNGSKQKVVLVNEVENHISQGWEYVATLSNDKAIVRLPF